jgi:hypothetical protein
MIVILAAMIVVVIMVIVIVMVMVMVMVIVVMLVSGALAVYRTAKGALRILECSTQCQKRVRPKPRTKRLAPAPSSPSAGQVNRESARVTERKLGVLRTPRSR